MIRSAIRRPLGKALPLFVALLGLLITAQLRADESVSSLHQELLREARSGMTTDAVATAGKLADICTPEAMDALLDGLRCDNYALEKTIGGMILKIPAGPALTRLCEQASKNKDYRVRVLLTIALAHRPETEAFKAVLTNLYDRFDSVALAALDAVDEKDNLGAVDHLIRALEYQERRGRSEGVVACEIRRVLVQLTGHDLEMASDWKSFWDAHKDGYKRPGKKDPNRQVTGVKRDPVRFFGTEVPAEKVIFLLDISGSMAIKDPMPEETARGSAGPRRGRTGVGSLKKKKKKEKPAQSEIPDSRMRLKRVQKELIKVITKIPAQTRFNIITFNHKIGKFEKHLVPATEGFKARAIDFVRGFQPQGETYTDDALRAAFENSEVTTIFLLSDGAPRRNNQLLPIQPILDWVHEQNRFRRVRLNTVGFKQAGSNLKKFMRLLAAQNHGHYEELR